MTTDRWSEQHWSSIHHLLVDIASEHVVLKVYVLKGGKMVELEDLSEARA